MKKCTETDKPLVSIVMAIYNPRMDWLKEQLASLDNQNYENIELLIIDDCSSTVSIEEIQSCVKETITNIYYEIMRNERNLGSTKTFEKLTLLAKGKYIAYCDQDDIWNEEKIKTLLDYFSKDEINLVYSDVQIIDESGRKKADGITEYRTRHILYEGFNLSEKLLIQNFVAGCTMLIKTEIAKRSVPFITEMVHDHYLALTASLDGELVLCRQPLVYYRIHGSNQTNTLAKVRNKQDYYEYKIKNFCDRIEQLEFKTVSSKIPNFKQIKKWAGARDSYYNGNLRSAKLLWKYRYYDLKVSLFELIMLKMPDPLFLYALRKIKEGKI